jgi:hypothetical protein
MEAAPKLKLVATACYSNVHACAFQHRYIPYSNMLQVCMFAHPVSHARLPLRTYQQADDPTRQACWLCHCFFTNNIVTHTDSSLTIATLTSSAAFDSWRPAYSQPHQCSTVQYRAAACSTASTPVDKTTKTDSTLHKIGAYAPTADPKLLLCFTLSKE